MVESAVLGLSVLTLGWIIQLIYSWSGRTEIKKRFLILYGLGTALLVIDSYMGGLMYTMTVNFICLVVVMLILMKVNPAKAKPVKVKAKIKRRR
jgi:heme A synthase